MDKKIETELYKYLQMLTYHAAWVPDTYQSIAKRTDLTLEVMNGVYLCGCAGVACEKVAGLLATKNPDIGIRQQVERLFSNSDREELEKMRDENAVLADEIGQLEEKLNEYGPELESMRKQLAKKDMELEKAKEELDRLACERQMYADAPEKQESVPEEIYDADSKENKVKKRWFRMRRKKKESAVNPENKNIRPDDRNNDSEKKVQDICSYIDGLMATGVYSTEQIGFIVDCFNEIPDIEVVNRIASPNFPVPVMEKLFNHIKTINKNQGGGKNG